MAITNEQKAIILERVGNGEILREVLKDLGIKKKDKQEFLKENQSSLQDLDAN